MNVVVFESSAEYLTLMRLHLLQTLAERGHRVLALAPERDASAVAARLSAVGVEYVPVPLERTGMNPWRDARSFRFLSRFFRDHRTEAILNYTIKPTIYGSLAAHRAGTRRICSIITGLGYLFIGESATHRWLRRAVLPLYRLALARNTVVLFQNPDDLALFRSLRLVSPGAACGITDGSGVDVDHYAFCELPQGPPSFLLVGRVLADKGVREFAAAAATLKRRHPTASFRLLGPFDTNPAAIAPAEVERWQTDGTLEYLGSTDDVRPHLSASSVFVLPSYREGTPRSTLEAMATGRAVVTTDAPGCRETVIHGTNGFLVPPRDGEALAGAMERYLVDAGLASVHGRESRRIAVERYDVRKINRAILTATGL